MNARGLLALVVPLLWMAASGGCVLRVLPAQFHSLNELCYRNVCEFADAHPTSLSPQDEAVAIVYLHCGWSVFGKRGFRAVLSLMKRNCLTCRSTSWRAETGGRQTRPQQGGGWISRHGSPPSLHRSVSTGAPCTTFATGESLPGAPTYGSAWLTTNPT